MKIKRVINNNIVVIVQDQQEVIVMGKGIGFKKHAGDDFDTTKVEKKFYPQDSDATDQLSNLLSDISLEDVRAASEILQLAASKLNRDLNDTELISLSDHIHNSLERKKQGIILRNNLLWEIKRFYPAEYRLGEDALLIIQHHTGVLLTDDEAGFIALHIVDAQVESGNSEANEITKFIQEVTQILKYACHQEIDERSNYYYRFVSHLKYLAQRVLNKNEIEENDDQAMFLLIQKQYPQEFSYANKIKNFVDSKYGCNLSNDELMYLTLHIRKMIQLKAKE